MKKLILLSLLSLFTLNCAPQNNIATENTNALKPEKNEDGEWELHVLDPQYETYLLSIAKPINQYTESTLKTRNSILVTEWNSLYFTGKYRNIIESSIDYDRNETYGLNFEYRLYQVFTYVAWKYKLKLNGVSQGDIR